MDGYDDRTYGDAFADVYDAWYADVTDVAATVTFLHRLLDETAPPEDPPGPASAPVLELAVGTGRIALALAATGLVVHGIDTSRAMLDRLRAKPGAEHVIVHEGDMATDLPPGPFAGAFVAYNSLFAVDRGRQARCLREVASRLVPRGFLAVEAFVPDAERPAGGTVGVRSLSADHVVLSVDVHHPGEQRIDGQFVEITETGGVRLRPWSVHYSSPDELDAMATAAGLGLVGRWESWDLAPFDEHSPRHVTVYRRT